MAFPILMLDLMRTYDWFEEELQTRLDALGWGRLGRSQSLILAHISNGETRASRIADNMGVTRQALSQFLAELTEKKLIVVEGDPDDKRARIIRYSPEAEAILKDARKVLSDIEREMSLAVGEEAFQTLRSALRSFHHIRQNNLVK